DWSGTAKTSRKICNIIALGVAAGLTSRWFPGLRRNENDKMVGPDDRLFPIGWVGRVEELSGFSNLTSIVNVIWYLRSISEINKQKENQARWLILWVYAQEIRVVLRLRNWENNASSLAPTVNFV
ncbi:4557_t:CDS:2, partial [Acaulospora morrowiae]